MSQLEETDDFYAAGRKIAKHIADSKDKEVSTATLQALIRDFLPQHEEVLEALRSIVARPDFRELVKLAGSEKGVAQKCAFIESLKKIYSAETAKAADNLTCGMMRLTHKTDLPDLGTENTTDAMAFQDLKGIANEARKHEVQYTEEKQEPKGSEAEPKDHGRLPTSQGLRNAVLILLASLGIAMIWEANQAITTVKHSQEELPRHVRNGAPLRMRNDSKIGNQLLAEVIARNAFMQCKDGGGSQPEQLAAWRQYWRFLGDKGLEWVDVDGAAYNDLTGSALEILRKAKSCESIEIKDLSDLVMKWIM